MAFLNLDTVIADMLSKSDGSLRVSKVASSNMPHAPVSWFTMESGFPDALGAHTLTAVSPDPTSTASGKFGNYALINTATATASKFSSDLDIHGYSSWTILSWARPETGAGTMYLASTGPSSPTKGFYVRHTSGGFTTLTASSDGTAEIRVDSTGNEAPRDQWSLFAFGYDSANTRAFMRINGGTYRTTTLASLNDPGRNLFLGNNVTASGNVAWVGGIDDTIVFDSALTDSQIDDYYLSGSGLTLAAAQAATDSAFLSEGQILNKCMTSSGQLRVIEIAGTPGTAKTFLNPREVLNKCYDSGSDALRVVEVSSPSGSVGPNFVSYTNAISGAYDEDNQALRVVAASAGSSTTRPLLNRDQIASLIYQPEDKALRMAV